MLFWFKKEIKRDKILLCWFKKRIKRGKILYYIIECIIQYKTVRLPSTLGWLLTQRHLPPKHNLFNCHKFHKCHTSNLVHLTLLPNPHWLNYIPFQDVCLRLLQQLFHLFLHLHGYWYWQTFLHFYIFTVIHTIILIFNFFPLYN